MTTIELNEAQSSILKEYLDRVLSDLSVEIAGTDRYDYRAEIKAERVLLREIVAMLAARSA